MIEKIAKQYNDFLRATLSLVLANSSMDPEAGKKSTVVLVKLLIENGNNLNAAERRNGSGLNIQMDLFFKGMQSYLKLANNNDFNIKRTPTEMEMGVFRVLSSTTCLTDLQLLGSSGNAEKLYADYLNGTQNLENALEFLLKFRQERFKLDEMQYNKNKSGDS